MTITQVQLPAAVQTTGTTVAVTWSSNPVSGNLLIVCVLVDRSAATSCTTPSGWNAVTPNEGVNSTRHIGFYFFWRVADGSNTTGHDAFSATVSANVGAVGLAAEYSGLTSTPHDADGTFQAGPNLTAGTITEFVTTTAAGDLVWSVVAGQAGNVPTVAWGGGSSSERAAANYNVGLYYATATQIAGAAGTISPTAAVSGITGTGLPIIAGQSFAFLSGGGGGGGGSTVAKANVAGALTAVTPKSNVAGTLTAVTPKINVGGSWVRTPSGLLVAA